MSDLCFILDFYYLSQKWGFCCFKIIEKQARQARIYDFLIIDMRFVELIVLDRKKSQLFGKFRKGTVIEKCNFKTVSKSVNTKSVKIMIEKYWIEPYKIYIWKLTRCWRSEITWEVFPELSLSRFDLPLKFVPASLTTYLL